MKYHADKDGFHAVVHTTGKNDHSGGSYHTEDHGHIEKADEYEDYGAQNIY